jgi:hypothetical protein
MMPLTSIYLVGCKITDPEVFNYDLDPVILAAFTEASMAMALASHLRAVVSRYELDVMVDELRHGLRPYMVILGPRAGLYTCQAVWPGDRSETPPFDDIRWTSMTDGPLGLTYVWAPSREEAITLARERLRVYKMSRDDPPPVSTDA